LVGVALLDFAIDKTKLGDGRRDIKILVEWWPGEYELFVGFDRNDDKSFEGVGDDFGWYEGTIDAPTFDQKYAKKIVFDRNMSVSFGIGTKP
jgi:hypothetical protein